MNEMKVIIAEDDLPSQTILAHFLELLPEYKVVGKAQNGEEFYEMVLKENPDIVLVDINMPVLNGIKAGSACKEMLPNLQVIFITGYDEFAIEAFNISATDYIVKPIERVRLLVALEKAKKQIQLSKKKNKAPNKLYIKSNNSFHYLSVDDILFIEKEGRRTILHTSTNQFETLESLQEIEERLPSYFFKTHRSYVVNLKTIERIDSSGETYLAKFPGINKVAYISKLKINEVNSLLKA